MASEQPTNAAPTVAHIDKHHSRPMEGGRTDERQTTACLEPKTVVYRRDPEVDDGGGETVALEGQRGASGLQRFDLGSGSTSSEDKQCFAIHNEEAAPNAAEMLQMTFARPGALRVLELPVLPISMERGLSSWGPRHHPGEASLSGMKEKNENTHGRDGPSYREQAAALRTNETGILGRFKDMELRGNSEFNDMSRCLEQHHVAKDEVPWVQETQNEGSSLEKTREASTSAGANEFASGSPSPISVRPKTSNSSMAEDKDQPLPTEVIDAQATTAVNCLQCMQQASNALAQCQASQRFSGSTEQIEEETILLISICEGVWASLIGIQRRGSEERMHSEGPLH